MGFPIGAPLEPSPYLQAFSRYLAPNISGSRPWPFGVTWRHWSCDHLMPHIAFPIGVPLLPTLYRQLFSKYWALNILWSRSWPIKVTWRHRTRDDLILHILFPVGSPLEPSPWLQAFSRYLALNCLSNANRHCACAISRELYPLCKIWVHIWIPHPHIAYSLWHFYWPPMKIKGCLFVTSPMLNAKSSENFLSDQNWANFGGFKGLGLGISKSFDFYSKGHMCSWIHVVWAILRQNRSKGVTSRSFEGKIKSQRLP